MRVFSLLTPSSRYLAVFVMLSVCLAADSWPLPVGPAHAQDSTPSEPLEDDQETARKAFENKEILPLGEVLARIQAAYTGDVVEIELERKSGKWVYEIELIDSDGRVREINVDGKTGEILTSELEQ